MSRSSQVVRSASAAGPSEAVTAEANFTWNCTLSSLQSTSVGSNETVSLATEWVFHFINEEDFDTTDTPVNRITIPRDGVYSVSARIGAFVDVASVEGLAGLNVHSNGAAGIIIDSEMRPLTTFIAGTSVGAWLLGSHAGWPFYAGDQIWLSAENRTAVSLDVRVGSLSVTYEAVLGNVNPLVGGG